MAKKVDKSPVDEIIEPVEDSVTEPVEVTKAARVKKYFRGEIAKMKAASEERNRKI